MNTNSLKRMGHNIIQYIILLGMIFLVQGCGVGFAVKGNDVTVVENPIIGSRKSILGGQSHDNPQTSAEDLIKYWSPPDDVSAEDTIEYWTYNTGIRWNGLKLIIAFIPLPLQVPVGHDHITFKIANNLVSQVTTTCDDLTYGLLCGYYPDPHNFRWVCGSYRIEETKKGRLLPIDFIGTRDDFEWLYGKSKQ